MRSIAISLVLIWHFDSLSFRIGWIGVDLFFILSGFLIGSILLKSADSSSFSYGSYIFNRFLRIYPLYIVSVVIYVLHLYSIGEIKETREIFIYLLVHAFFLQTVLFEIVGKTINYYQVTWSLVVEVVFYLTIPFFLILLRRLNGLWIGIGLTIIGFILFRFWLSSTYLPNDHNWQFFLFLKPYYRIDELILGVAVAIAAYNKSQENDRFSLFIGLVIIAAASLYIHTMPGADKLPSMALFTRDGVFIPTVLSLGFALIAFGVYQKQLSCWWINCIARLAYPLYLLHMFTLHVSSGIVSYLTYTITAAVLASYFVEYPFIRLYKKSNKQSLLRNSTGSSGQPEILIDRIGS